MLLSEVICVRKQGRGRGHLEDGDGDYFVGLLDQGLYHELSIVNDCVWVGVHCVLEQLPGCRLSNL